MVAASQPKPLGGQHMQHAHGSKSGRRGQSEATRNAESLFEARTVAEIREIEARTRKDIESKKQQLRQLVGDSYRDLIDSADKIVSIASHCGSILQNVKEIQQGFSFLSHSFTTADNLLNEKRDSLSRHEELYAIGGRVSYLVDTPEVLWGCLDSQQHLSAAQRFLRAQVVYQQLHHSFAQDMLSKFPLLQHQWPVVLNFKSHIAIAVQNCLSGDTAQPMERTADALAALTALNEQDTQYALQQLLAARREAFRQQLQGATGTGLQGETADALDPQQVAAVLAQAAAIIQTTVHQIGKLFLTQTGPRGTSGAAEHGSCQLQLLVRDVEADVGELQFGGRAVGGSGAATADVAPELMEWQKASKATQARLVALSSGMVERTATTWVRELAEDAVTQGATLLHSCVNAQQLVDLELGLRTAITAWKSTSTAAGGGMGTSTLQAQLSVALGEGGTHLTRTLSPHITTPLATAVSGSLPSGLSLPAGGLRPPSGSAPSAQLSWESVCEGVLGTQLNLWQEVFQQLFVARAKQLIKEGFEAIPASVGPQLDQLLQQAAVSIPEPAGQVQCSAWPQLPLSRRDDGEPGRSSASGAPANQLHHGHKASRSTALLWSERLGPGGARGTKADPAQEPTGFRFGVLAIREHIDQQLLSVLQSSLLLLGWEPSLQSAASGSLQTASSVRGLLSMPSIHSSGPGRSSGSGTFGSRGAGPAGFGRDPARSAELEPFIQTLCSDTAIQLSNLLHARLAALGSPPPGSAGAVVAEQALLLGRLCCGLAWDSKYLSVLLGPPEAWRAAATNAGNTTGSGGHSAAARAAVAAGRAGLNAGAGKISNSRVQAVSEQLRSTAVLAFSSWATCAASCLVSSFKAGLQADDTLISNSTPLSWQETIIPAQSTAEASLDLEDVPITDMKFSLPACPSASAQALLAAACNEVRRAGDHTMPAEALQVFEWELLGACLNCVSHLLGADQLPSSTSHHSTAATAATASTLPGMGLGRKITEKGVLQLLFDLRLIRDVLAGGRLLVKPGGMSLQGDTESVGTGHANTAAGPHTAVLDQQDASALAAVSERRKAGTLLEQQLQDQLDPIDWATYEHHLWGNVQRHYQRCSALYGILTQLHKSHPDAGPASRAAGAKAAASTVMSALNPLGMLPVAPRFQYLPIAVPGSTSGSLLAAGKARLSVPSFGQLAQGADSSSDLAGAYSFADLGTSNSRTTSAAAHSTSAAAAASSSLAAGALSGASGFHASAQNAFGSLQARLGGTTGALGSLGTLLGDKAAEVTALAGAKFDLANFSDFANAAGGLGSGLLSSFVNKTSSKK